MPLENDETTTMTSPNQNAVFLASGLLAGLLAVGCGTSEGKPAAAPGDEPATEVAARPQEAPVATLGEDREPEVLDTGFDLKKISGAGQQQEHGPDDGHDHGAHGDVDDGGLDVVDPSTFGSLTYAEGTTQKHDFGEVPQGEKRTKIFTLAATGENPLVLKRIKPSCGCTVAEVRKVTPSGERMLYNTGEPIAPGEQFEVEAAIKTDGRQGKFSSTITLYTNTAEGFLNLHLSASILPILSIEGESVVNFGQISAADQVEKSVKIKSELLDPFKLEADPAFLVAPLAAEVVPIDPDGEGRSKTWEVKVTLGPSIPEGVRSYPLRLVTDSPKPGQEEADPEVPVEMYDVRVFVQAQVTGLVSASPNFISFGMVRPGQTIDRTSRIICHDDFKLATDMPFRLEGLRGDEFPYADAMSVTLEPVPGEPGSLDLRLRLEGLPEDLNGSFGGLVKLDVGHPLKEELLVRFSGVCRPGIPQRPVDGGQD